MNKMENNTNNDFKYEENDSKIIIQKYLGSSGEVVIPSEIDGKPVTTIGPAAFSDCTSLTSVEIPDGVTEIGENAFASCPLSGKTIK